MKKVIFALFLGVISITLTQAQAAEETETNRQFIKTAIEHSYQDGDFYYIPVLAKDWFLNPQSKETYQNMVDSGKNLIALFTAFEKTKNLSIIFSIIVRDQEVTCGTQGEGSKAVVHMIIVKAVSRALPDNSKNVSSTEGMVQTQPVLLPKPQ